jgi:hypothetical protein
MKARYLVGLLAVLLATAGCNSVRQVMGIANTGEPTINLKSAETRWLLIKNPRFGDVRSEPEYIWVEEDKLPTTVTTLLRGKSAIIAPPEIVAKYGAPPGGGKISPRQGVPYQDNAPRTATGGDPRAAGSAAPATPAVSAQAALPAPAPGTPTPRAAAPGPQAAPAAPAPEPPTRGFVVYVDTTRIVIDLTATDGIRAGSVIGLRRDQIPIVHPVTGEVLGQLDDEVATARITETRDRFSVAEIQSVAAGAQVQVKDRVVIK